MNLLNLLALLAIVLFPCMVWGATADLFLQLNKLPPVERQQRLIEGAKKEGEVMLYSSSGLEETHALVKAFEKKYPFIQTRYNRKGGSQLFTVAQMEFVGKKYLVDVYWAGYSTIGPMLKEKSMLARYISPETAAVAANKDKEGYWVATRISMAILAYHAKKVPAGKVPKNYYELLDPFWKGTISIDSSPARFTHLLAEKYGWEKWKVFTKNSRSTIRKFTVAGPPECSSFWPGESLAGLDINADNIIGMQKEGAPLDFAVMDPTLLSLTSAALPQNPAHPQRGGALL